MKLVSRSIFTILVLATISVAQSTSTSTKANSSDAASRKVQASQGSTARKTPRPETTEPTATAETPKLTDSDKRAYALGVEFGQDVARAGMQLNRDLLIQGMKDALTDAKFLMTVEDMNATLAGMQKEEHDKIAAAMKALAEKNKKDGEAFLAMNKIKDGVVTLPSGLQYKVLKAADGKKPGLDDNVVCNYRGMLLDGTEIDSSYKRNQPSTFPLKGVIKGWTEALQLMPVGSKWQVFVPSDMAYGDRGNGRNIGPNATLIFEVELLSIVDKAQDQARPAGVPAKPQGSL